MSFEYRFLVLEDVESDAELIIDQVKLAGLNCSFQVASDEIKFKELLELYRPHLVLADYTLPDYDGMSALTYIIEKYPDIPVIIVTGSINEETAVKCMKIGAVDYVLKDKLNRLSQAVITALKNAEIKKERERIQKELVKSKNYYMSILKWIPDDIIVIDGTFTIVDVNNEKLKNKLKGKLCYRTLHNHNTPCCDYGVVCPLCSSTEGTNPVRYQRSITDKNGKNKKIDVLVAPIYSEAAEQIKVVEAFRDITELEEARENITRLSTAIGQSSTAVLIMDKEGRLVYANMAFLKLSGYQEEAVLGKPVSIIGTGVLSSGEHNKLLKESLEKPVRNRIYKNKRPDGEEYWVSVTTTPYMDDDGNLLGIVETQEDITERMEKQKRIERSLEEKDLLLHEIYHRVNNNMQIVISLLSMQAERAKLESEKELLSSVQLRVTTMSLIEHMLYQEGDLTRIAVKNIVDRIFVAAMEIYGRGNNVIELHTEIEDGVVLSLKEAQPWAMVVTELLSNCIKHAYPEVGGIVEVTVSRNKNGKIVLSVRDYGKGLPEAIIPSESDTSGFKLLYLLAEGQLGGKVIFEKNGGTMIRVEY